MGTIEEILGGGGGESMRALGKREESHGQFATLATFNALL